MTCGESGFSAVPIQIPEEGWEGGREGWGREGERGGQAEEVTHPPSPTITHTPGAPGSWAGRVQVCGC